MPNSQSAETILVADRSTRHNMFYLIGAVVVVGTDAEIERQTARGAAYSLDPLGSSYVTKRPVRHGARESRTGTVRSRVSRGREALRKLMDRRVGTEAANGL